jgi:cysteinyl-tRNA synthetase
VEKLQARRADVGEPLGAGPPRLAHRMLGDEHEIPRPTPGHPRRHLVFPHHENELVQSESFTGETFATYWLHNGLLTKEGRKISKSDPGTIVLMSDLLKAHKPDTLRALLLSSHYRRPIDFGPHRLDEIDRSLQTFYRAFERYAELTGEQFENVTAPTRRGDLDPGDSALLKEIAEHREQFLGDMDDDFNTGGAIGELFEIVHALNRYTHQLPAVAGSISADQLAEYKRGISVLKELSQILGLFKHAQAAAKPPDNALSESLMTLLIDLRARLRKEKNFALADEVRKRLAELGVTLEDRPDGTRWRVESKR